MEFDPKKKLFDMAKKGLKNKVMGNNNNNSNKSSQTRHADTIIRNHVIWSMGAGLIPILVADVFAVSALQVDMIKQLSNAYDRNFTESQGKAIVSSLTSTTLARVGARSLVKLIPGVGSVIGGVTVSIFAGASTYALGQVFKSHFESGGTFLDFDPDRLKRMYREQFEKGKEVVKQWKQDSKLDEKVEEYTQKASDVVENAVSTAEEMAESVVESFMGKDEQVEETPTTEQATETPKSEKEAVIDQLSKLGDLMERGVISEEEFKTLKEKLLHDL